MTLFCVSSYNLSAAAWCCFSRGRLRFVVASFHDLSGFYFSRFKGNLSLLVLICLSNPSRIRRRISGILIKDSEASLYHLMTCGVRQQSNKCDKSQVVPRQSTCKSHFSQILNGFFCSFQSSLCSSLPSSPAKLIFANNQLSNFEDKHEARNGFKVRKRMIIMCKINTLKTFMENLYNAHNAGFS